MQLDLPIFMQALGVGFILIGFSVRTGLWKNWYWRTRGGAYAYVPMGIIFLMYSFQDLLIQRFGLPLVVAIFVVFIALVLWFSLRPPEFLKPIWVTWVEKNPKKVIRAMGQEVIDGEKWEPWVASEADVDAWAARVAKKLPKDK